jgi:adenosylmethionine-8-amino-7-oxononanoate aminotransferase
MSGGYAPLAAILIRDHVAAAFYGEEQDNVQFHHGHTYGGNPVACAAGLAVLNEFLERNVIDNVRRQGERLRQRLNQLAEQFAIIGEVRGVGLLQGFEFVKNRATRKRFASHVRPGKVLEHAARARGLLLRCGNEFAAFAPPLTISGEEIDEMTRRLGDSLAAAAPSLL